MQWSGRTIEIEKDSAVGIVVLLNAAVVGTPLDWQTGAKIAQTKRKNEKNHSEMKRRTSNEELIKGKGKEMLHTRRYKYCILIGYYRL